MGKVKDITGVKFTPMKVEPIEFEAKVNLDECEIWGDANTSYLLFGEDKDK